MKNDLIALSLHRTVWLPVLRIGTLEQIYRMVFKGVSDHDGHYDIDGVSLVYGIGVIVASDAGNEIFNSCNPELYFCMIA